MFDMMAKLFCLKWSNVEADFIEYFKKQWLGVHINWFEGAAQFTPSTNNGVESHNAVIKRKITLRRRLPLNQFLVAMKQLTMDISMQFHNDDRSIATEPKIDKNIRIKGAAMYQNKFKCFKARNSTNETVICLVPSSQCDESMATEKHYRSLVKRQWVSFDEFIVHGHHIFYIVQICVEAWNTQSTCTCVSFFKNNICKHIIAVAMKEKVIQCLDTDNPTLLEKRKNPGRVPYAKRALEKQN